MKVTQRHRHHPAPGAMLREDKQYLATAAVTLGGMPAFLALDAVHAPSGIVVAPLIVCLPATCLMLRMVLQRL